MGWIPVYIETPFRRGAAREHVTNGGPVGGRGVVIHAIRDDRTRVIVEYDRYNGSGSRLGLWTRVIEEVPATEFWEVL